MRDEGKTVFLTTHYMEEAERLCDDLVIINQGKLIAQDSPGNLINEFFGESAIEFAVSRLTPAQKGQLEMRFQKNKIRTIQRRIKSFCIPRIFQPRSGRFRFYWPKRDVDRGYFHQTG